MSILTNLYEEEFLKFDFTKNIWNWNFEEIKKQNISDNVIELMKNKIHKLPKNTQDILKIASCIGNRFELRTLSIIYKKTEETAKNILRIAILENLIFPVDNRNFKFVHDKIQQAIYSTIPENEKNIFHLQTGKLLLKFLDKKDLEKRIFDVVNQINHGINLIENESERKQFAELNLQAGLKAKYSSAYFTSYNYLKISRNLLEKNSWKSNYEFTLQVYNEITEVSYLANDFKNTEKFVDIINNNIKKFIDKIHSNIMLIYSYNSQSFYDKSIYLALYLLKKFDFILPLKPSKIDVLKEFIKMELYFFIKKGTDFSKLPEMSDKKQEIIMKILSSIDTAVYHYQQLLFPIVSFKTSRLFVKYGAYKNNLYYFLTISVFYMEMLLLKKFYKIIDEIYKLSLKLNIQNNNEKFHFVYSYMNLFWFKKLHFIVEEFNTVFKIANEKGNLEYASYGLINNTYLMFFTDEKLTKIRKISIDNNIKLKKLNIKMAIEFNSIAIQMYENLINKTDKYCDLEGEYFEENKGVKSIILDKNYNNLSSYYIIKSILSIIFNDFNNIEIYLDGIEKYNKEFQFGSYYNTIGVFYSSLLYLQLYEKKRDKKFLNKAIKNQKLMKVWAKCCVENFQHKYDLVESEKFRLTGEKAKAQDFYNKAIKGANKNQFTSEEAISWEFAGRFYLEEKNEMLSKIYLQNAYKTYQKWDALSKLKQLEEKYPQFSFEKENTKSSSFTNQNTTIISSTATAIGTNSSSFDLESIVKASQSLSGEVKLEKLLKSILMIIMENAGADYAVIIKNDNENFTIEAKGKYGFENITVLQSENLDTSKSVILNMVKYVIRTKKSVLIDDISKNKDYENDEYLKNTQKQNGRYFVSRK
ncbi:MAG: hypothetical protein B6I24_03965 [Bacteroidetes bacterium 4572_128]|nr:MAG: hypothetical protein B6I24_03965 [Bacteroidetes bacterium 4572_128]